MEEGGHLYIYIYPGRFLLYADIVALFPTDKLPIDVVKKKKVVFLMNYCFSFLERGSSSSGMVSGRTCQLGTCVIEIHIPIKDRWKLGNNAQSVDVTM